MEDGTQDIDREPGMETEALLRDLGRRNARFALFLKVRAGIGVGMIVLGSLCAMGALGIVAVAVGIVGFGAVAEWTHGAGAILAPFPPAALAFLLIRTGLVYWRGRHPEDPDPGCVAG